MARNPQPQLIAAQWELVRRLPAPRRVRSRVGTRILYGLIIVLSVGVPGGIAGLIAKDYFELATLRSRGVATNGRLVHLATKTIGSRSKSTVTTLDYEFEVEGRPYRFNMELPGVVRVPTGPAEVVYLPEDPRRATSRSFLSLPFLKTQSPTLMIVAAVIFVIMVPAGWYLTRSFRRHGRLLAHGVPAVATVDAVEKRGTAERKVGYAFQAGGVLRQGSVVVMGVEADKTEPGQRLAMLFDPADPNRTDLFFAAVASYLIVEPAASRVAAPVGT
jgi:hypothetical protein